jgi:hypothetical protein
VSFHLIPVYFSLLAQSRPQKECKPYVHAACFMPACRHETAISAHMPAHSFMPACRHIHVFTVLVDG